MFRFTVPTIMRVFEPASRLSNKFFRTVTSCARDEIVNVTDVRAMCYDHRTLIALRLDDGFSYLLVEEISPEARELSYKWQTLYVKYKTTEQGKDDLETIQNALADIVKQHAESGSELNWEHLTPLLA